jgi:hypothetical protein
MIVYESQNNPTVLTLKSADGMVSKVKVSLKYIPIKMQLDSSESINNMGNLRVDVLDGANLPAADRSGFSDPYCKFELNGKDVYKTKVQKKTLHPAWNEFFEIPVSSRTAAKFKVKVYDWDFGESPDFLGQSDINLELLDPFTAREYTYHLDGKSGTIRLRMVFKPDYVTRSRQGSSTFSGTFATPGKIVTGVAGAPVKGVGMVSGGVVKGASFIKHGFRGKKKSEANGFSAPEAVENSDSMDVPRETTELAPPRTPDPGATPPHTRNKSFGAQSINSFAMGKGTDTGVATFNIVSATGYPPSANVRVHVKQINAKGAKDLHKSKAIKSATGEVHYEGEMFKQSCSADTQFQVQVKDHTIFGSDDDLGEGLFFVDDSNTGSDRVVKAGPGSVTLRTSFMANDAASVRDSPKGGQRRSFLSRGSTPA